jgi:hypothetical protein
LFTSNTIVKQALSASFTSNAIVKREMNNKTVT